MNERALGTLGLALKAGRVVCGLENVQREIGKCRGVLLAADAGSSVSREARFLSERAKIPMVTLPWPKETVGRALGKHLCSIAAVTDGKLYRSIINAVPAETGD